MKYTLTIATRHIDWTARIAQFIFGLGQLAVAIALYACASVQWRFSTGPQGYLVSLIPLAMATILISGIGICYCKNRQNIHWKIMSVLDWLAVFATVASVALGGVATSFNALYSLRFFVPLNLSTVVAFLSSLFLAIRKHRPSDNSSSTKLESFYSEEEGPRDYQPETVRSTRRISQAMSRAETNARWSGVSGADTTVFTSMHADAVPPYTNGRTSPVNSMLKE